MVAHEKKFGSRATCSLCGLLFPPHSLEHASAPSTGAVVALGVSDPDDYSLVETDALIDHNQYCPTCVQHVNRRRKLFLLFVCLAIPVAVYIVKRMMG